MDTTIPEIFHTMDYGLAPEDAIEATRWLDTNHRSLQHLLDGRWLTSRDTLETHNPATGEPLATLPLAREPEIQQAIEAARRAQAAWQVLPGSARAQYLRTLARHAEKHLRRLALLDTLTTGAPLRLTRDHDLPLAIRILDHHAGSAQLLATTHPATCPLGVSAAILSADTPLLSLIAHLAPALAAGCTVIVQPTAAAALSAFALAQLAEEVALPPGVLNLLLGDHTTATLLAQHPGLDHLSFSGPTERGREIRRLSAPHPVELTLRLAAANSILVLDDADLDSAVDAILEGAFLRSPSSLATPRLLLQERIADRLLAKLRARMANLRLGSPLDQNADMGPLATGAELIRLQTLIDRAQSEGAIAWQPDIDVPRTGSFLLPTLLTNIYPANSLFEAEMRGPLLAALTFRTPAEAIELANNSRFALAASLCTENSSTALTLAQELRASIVWVNAVQLLDPASPLTGSRDSGFGNTAFDAFLMPATFRGADQDGSPITLPEPAPGTEFAPKSTPQPRGTLPSRPHKDLGSAIQAAAAAAPKWARQSPVHRSQTLACLAETLKTHRLALVAAFNGALEAETEVSLSIERMFAYAAWATHLADTVSQRPARSVALNLYQPLGTVGILAPAEAPLLALLSLILPNLAAGNAIVAIPSPHAPHLLAELAPLLESSGLPIHLAEGDPLPLAQHDSVDALWCFRDQATATLLKTHTADSLKPVFSTNGRPLDWFDPAQAEGAWYLRHATSSKQVWLPYSS